MNRSKSSAGSPPLAPTRFTLADPAAGQVGLAGSFNDWEPAPMKRSEAANSPWEIEVALPAGSHEYLFVVDGRWQPDPQNPNSVPNPFGGMNSVVEVSAPTARRSRRTPKSNL